MKMTTRTMMRMMMTKVRMKSKERKGKIRLRSGILPPWPALSCVGLPVECWGC
jgi:hypothetical protein